jgi:hypothetical protein
MRIDGEGVVQRSLQRVNVDHVPVCEQKQLNMIGWEVGGKGKERRHRMIIAVLVATNRNSSRNAVRKKSANELPGRSCCLECDQQQTTRAAQRLA